MTLNTCNCYQATEAWQQRTNRVMCPTIQPRNTVPNFCFKFCIMLKILGIFAANRIVREKCTSRLLISWCSLLSSPRELFYVPLVTRLSIPNVISAPFLLSGSRIFCQKLRPKLSNETGSTDFMRLLCVSKKWHPFSFNNLTSQMLTNFTDIWWEYTWLYLQ